MKIALIGDVMVGRLVNEALKEVPPEYPWGDTLLVLQDADLRVCNLECVISDRETPWKRTPKVFHFRSDAKNIDVLNRARMDLLSLANNHSLDYEYEALREMLALLDQAQIGHAGAGENFEQASRVAIVEAAESKIGLIAVTDNEPSWKATRKAPGIYFVPIDLDDSRAGELFNLISSSRSSVDFLIVSVHWGPNWGYRPQPGHIPFAHALIDAGADLVFGHSCHVFRGIEFYRDSPILYSCGDFVDDYAVDPIERNDRSFIFRIELEERQVRRLRLYPTVIRNFQARLAESPLAREISHKMQSLCADFRTSSSWNEDGGYLEISRT